jgi:hypothetical protein
MGMTSDMRWMQRGECVAEAAHGTGGDFYSFCFTSKEQQDDATNDMRKRVFNTE